MSLTVIYGEKNLTKRYLCVYKRRFRRYINEKIKQFGGKAMQNYKQLRPP